MSVLTSLCGDLFRSRKRPRLWLISKYFYFRKVLSTYPFPQAKTLAGAVERIASLNNMNIEILKDLKNSSGRNLPISLSEIEILEQKYNNGVSFPRSLKELLYVAGQHCDILDYGLSVSQIELQDMARECLSEVGKSITTPFYVIEIRDAGDFFLFVYLNQGHDPLVNEALTYKDSQTNFITGLTKTLSSFLLSRLSARKQGFNPF
ncbi:SMI1/KNR4 family protein [Mucilaginibacter terrae]|uniref:SMI1/KNR4 family protein n=1 Tax=Mucilaginibacter terrae TaxID=1955052 RepID=A0ABU3GRQ3_9SPHI|nr:SMI1/KNR4 family protein [Mucilaginibacter terrae]MDT3402458.1 hypothetical protein [Mucilaginibacter terrae]